MTGSIIEGVKNAIDQQIVGDPVWAAIALIGQVFFGGRFILQWLASEHKHKSHVPTSFWYLSIAGSVLLLSYSIHIRNPIFVLSFSLNTMIYLRNLHLLYLESRQIA
jgi:lipid-A-disaccharide synthase-like uncharacterized protein